MSVYAIALIVGWLLMGFNLGNSRRADTLFGLGLGMLIMSGIVLVHLA